MSAGHVDRSAGRRVDDRGRPGRRRAGLRADDVAGLIGDTSFGITPRKGQFLVSEEAFGFESTVVPTPVLDGKGMLVTPIVFGGLLGPTAVDGTDKDECDSSIRSRPGPGRSR